MSEQGASEGCEPNEKGRYVPWSPEEDEQLRKLVEEHGARHWTTLAQFMPNRNSKSCRLRWVNQLRGDLKRTGFTPEEDEVIIRGHLKHGNKWTVIARDLPGRTDNAVKNRWHSTLRKRVQQQAELRQQLVSAAGIAEMANQPEAAQLLTNLASNLDQNPQEAAQLQALLASMSGATPTGRSTSSVAVSETAMDELLGTLAARAGLDPATCSTASSVARPPPQLMSQLQGVLQQAGMLLPGGQQHATSAAAAADASMLAPPTAAPMHGCAPSTTDLVMPSTSPLAITFGCDSGLAADAGAIAAAASVGSIGRADSSGPHQHFAGRRHVEAELPQAGSMPPPQRHGSRHAPKRHGSSGSTTTGPQNPSTLAPRDADVAADAAAATVGPEAPTAGPTGVAALLHSLTPEQLMWMAYMKKTQGQGMPPLAGPSMAPATSLHPSLCNPVCAPQPAAAEAPQAAPLERQRKRGLSSAAASERAGSSGVATGSVSEAPKRPRMERVASDVFMHEPCMASATQSVATLQGGMGGPDAALPVGLAVMELQQQQQLVQMQVMGMLGGMPGMPAAGLLAPLAAPLPPMAPQLAALAQEGMAPAGGVGLQALMQTNMSMQTNTSMQTNMLAQLASVGLQALMAAQQQSQQSQQQQAMAAQQQVMQANMLQHYLQRVADQQAHAPAARRATKRTRATVTEPPAVATMAAAAPAASAAGGAPAAMAAAADADALGGLGGMELPSDQQLAQLCWDMDTTEFPGFNTPLGSLSDLTALLPADKAATAAPMEFETVADAQPKAAGSTPGLPQLLFHAAPAAPATAPAAPAMVVAPEAAAVRSSTCGYAALSRQELGDAPMGIMAPPPPPLFPACPQLGQLPPALAALAPMLPHTAPAPAPPPSAPTAAAAAQPLARLQRRGSAGAAAKATTAAAARVAAPAAAAPAALASEPAAAAPALPSHHFDFWLPGAVPFTAATAFMMGTVTPASSSSTATSCPPALDPPGALKSQALAAAKAKAPAPAAAKATGGNPPANAAFSFAPGLGSCKPPAAPKLATTAATVPPQPPAGHISSSRSYSVAAAPFPCGTMASLLMGRGFGRGKGPMDGSKGAAAASTSSCSSGGGVEEDEEVPEWLAKAACPEPLGLGSMFEPLMMNNVVATAALSAAD